MSNPPPSASKLSHLSTTILTLVLELERSHQLSLPSSPSLIDKITKNLSSLSKGIDQLEEKAGGREDEVLKGLKQQEERIIGLVKGLGVHVQESQRRSGRGKTGKLVDTGEDDDEDEVDPFESGDDAVPLADVRPPPHVSIRMSSDDETNRDLNTMEEDEEAMRRANSEVMQLQQRMMEDQDTQLDSLSSAISRQHALSLRVAEELELHSNLIDDTEAAVDRTDANLRRASGRLDQFAKKARNTGSTGLIIALIVILVVLIIVFKF
ncbi:syntaxin [Sporobolomyces salmoneus]|uniref:syntaxin n=1 Tax=Sporobolomyces salmoneus TaxID=183962 RepID=UPI003176655B